MTTFKKSDCFMMAGDNRNNLTFWYPKIQGLVRAPETIIVPVNFRAYWKVLDGAPMPKRDDKRFYGTAERLGYPIFMRTSVSSDKHSWKNTCYIESRNKLKQNLFNLIEHDAMAFNCKNICQRFIAHHRPFHVSGYRFGKYCQECGRFLDVEGWSCPCCGSKLRGHPKKKHVRRQAPLLTF